ncbi:MAG: SLBB domain-containing protein [Chitinivibrionales bacterium]|nr:SLBB domain-containing protein [Chitinivibrionales bacterium]
MINTIEQNGVVGAGGAGFPTAVKFKRTADTFIVNAAECEPLLHKDRELLLHHTGDFFAGLATAMQVTAAKQGYIGIKEKHADVIALLKKNLPHNVSICALRDVYPAGDEFVLVYDVTGKVIPPGGLPLDVGVIVNNVETLVNIGRKKAVTTKFITVAGAVKKSVTLEMTVGSSLQDALTAAGGATEKSFGALAGGTMMGRLAKSLDEPITKTTGGLIILPEDHFLIRRYSRTVKQTVRIARAACDQCSFCTEWCPRYLLGHPVQPHLAMRSLGFSDTALPLAGALFCSDCNLCSLCACPEDLDPRAACQGAKSAARQAKVQWQGKVTSAHALNTARRVPIKRLMQKLGLTEFVNHAPLLAGVVPVKQVTIPLRQHIGAPAVAVVKPGQRVSAGELVADIAPGALGAKIHTGIAGMVVSVGETIIIKT